MTTSFDRCKLARSSFSSSPKLFIAEDAARGNYGAAASKGHEALYACLSEGVSRDVLTGRVANQMRLEMLRLDLALAILNEHLEVWLRGEVALIFVFQACPSLHYQVIKVWLNLRSLVPFGMSKEAPFGQSISLACIEDIAAHSGKLPHPKREHEKGENWI